VAVCRVVWCVVGGWGVCGCLAITMITTIGTLAYAADTLDGVLVGCSGLR
jgi:hypothetical protein